MKILILAAGYGTRLYPLIKDTPKALLDINGRPLLNHVLDKVVDLDGLTEVMLVTNNKFYGHFQEWVGTLSDFPFTIKVINDGTMSPDDRLGSIGDIDFALKQENVDDDLLVIGSDNLFDFNVSDYIAFARNCAPNVSLGLYDIENLEEAKKFGVIKLDESGKITLFEEKPENPQSTLVSMCFYYLPKESLSQIGEYLLECGKSDTAGDYIRWMVAKNDVYGFKFFGKWYDIGSIEAYEEARNNFC